MTVLYFYSISSFFELIENEKQMCNFQCSGVYGRGVGLALVFEKC